MVSVSSSSTEEIKMAGEFFHVFFTLFVTAMLSRGRRPGACDVRAGGGAAAPSSLAMDASARVRQSAAGALAAGSKKKKGEIKILKLTIKQKKRCCYMYCTWHSKTMCCGSSPARASLSKM